MNTYKMYLSTEHMSYPICLQQPPPPPPLAVIHVNSDLVSTTLEFWPDSMVVIKDHFSFHARERVPVCCVWVFILTKPSINFFLLNLNELKCKTFYSVHFDKSWNIPLRDVQILQIYFSEQRIHSFDKLLYKRQKKD